MFPRRAAVSALTAHPFSGAGLLSVHGLVQTDSGKPMPELRLSFVIIAGAWHAKAFPEKAGHSSHEIFPQKTPGKTKKNNGQQLLTSQRHTGSTRHGEGHGKFSEFRFNITYF